MRTIDCFEFEDVEGADASFTLSYSPEIKAWVSFHDYTPDVYIDSTKGLLSFKQGQMYKHNVGRKGQYYTSEIHPCYIEPVFNYGQNVMTETIDWKVQVERNNVIQYDKTLTSLIVYNDTQCSNFVEIKPFGRMYEASGFNINGVWKLNKFRDMVIDSYAPFKIGHDFNASNLAIRKPFFKSKHFVSNYLICRFIFSNIYECEFNLTDVGTNGSIDPR